MPQELAAGAGFANGFSVAHLFARRRHTGKLADRIPVDQCLKAADDCQAPIVNLCGGEPTLWPGIGRLCAAFRRAGLQVKLDTNGTHPDRLAALLPNAREVEPPWSDTEWNERVQAAQSDRAGLFVRWPLLAPQLLEWARV